MIIIFQILAVILAGVAAYFLWVDNWDGVFVTAVVSISSFFLGMRFQIKARLAQRNSEQLRVEEMDDK